MEEGRTSAKDRRVSKIPRSRTLANIIQRNRVECGKENDVPQPASQQAPEACKKQPAKDVHRSSRGGKPPRPTIKHARSLEDLKPSKEQSSTVLASSAAQKPRGGVPQAASYQELKRLCHKLTQEQAIRREELAATEKKMDAMKEEMTSVQSVLSHAQQSLEESAREHKAASDALSVVSAERDAYLMLLERNGVDVQSGEMVVSTLKAASEDMEIQLQVEAFRVSVEEVIQMFQKDTTTLKEKAQDFKGTVIALTKPFPK